MVASGITLIHEDVYPGNLKHITKPPLKLFFKGDISLFQHRFCLSIVGSRKHSQYGKRVVTDLLSKLKKFRGSLVIVSGLALGIDTLVHEKCLEYGFKTAAVLPLGLNKITPLINISLHNRILNNRGIILAEDAEVGQYRKYHYPRRNRIIAGLSNITLIIEAGINSGAVTTANLAFDENRQVIALPGNIFSPFSTGSNRLIKENKAEIYAGCDQIIYELSRWDN